MTEIVIVEEQGTLKLPLPMMYRLGLWLLVEHFQVLSTLAAMSRPRHMMLVTKLDDTSDSRPLIIMA